MKNISFSVHFFITDDLIALCYEYGFCVENIPMSNAFLQKVGFLF